MTSAPSMSPPPETERSGRPRSSSPAHSRSSYEPRFRFKGESSRSDSPSRHSSRTSLRHRKHKHRSRRRTGSPSPSSRAHECDRSRSPNPPPRDISPNTAFREALFDAMADDEGAAYWEGVYGQPIHIYPPPDQSGDTYEGGDYNNPNVLDADAYAAYVRRKMWEKSHEHIMEERARREAEAEKRRAERDEEFRARRMYAEKADAYWDKFRRRQGEQRSGSRVDSGDAFADDLEAGLRRGEMRREEKKWKSACAEYARKWEVLLERARKTEIADASDKKEPRGQVTVNDDDIQLPWPVLSGKEKDVEADTVRKFLRQYTKMSNNQSSNPTNADSTTSLRNQLKLERVRWHPDKVMQRFAVNDRTLQTVTAVFQVIDQMWSEEKGKV